MFILTCQQRRKYFVHAGAAVCVLSCLLLPGCADKQGVRPISPDNAWHEFEGTWTAEGSRTTMQLGSGRRASIVTYKGSLVLSGPSRPGVGFLSDAIVFNDTETGAVGRAVWTDEHGDKAFSELRGEGTTTNNKITGTFVGGTGRYAGATGNYEFSWRFVLENGEGPVQGQSLGLKGQIRVAPDAVALAAGEMPK